MNLLKPDQKRVVGFGELLMRLHCPDGKRFQNAPVFEIYFGGSEANVCVFLSGLGFKTKYITVVPENDLAKSAIMQLRSYSVDVSAIQFAGDKMGLYFTENGNSIRNSKVVYDRKNSSFNGIMPGMIDWETVLKGADCFHWSGISAAVSQNAADVCLEALIAAKQHGLTIVADLNYRSTLWDYGKHPSSIMPGLLSYADIIVGDINSASIYFDLKIDGSLSREDQFRESVVLLKERLPAMKTMAMSFRNTNEYHLPLYQGALYHDENIYFSKDYIIPVTVDRVGSGDAFTGGLLFALLNNYNPEKIIAFACAAGILKHSLAGDFACLHLKELLGFIDNGFDSRIIR